LRSLDADNPQQVPPDRKGRLALLAHKAHKDRLVQAVRKARRGRLELPERKVHKDQPVPPDLRV